MIRVGRSGMAPVSPGNRLPAEGACEVDEKTRR